MENRARATRLERGTHRGLGLDFSLCYFDLAERFAFLRRAPHITQIFLMSSKAAEK